MMATFLRKREQLHSFLVGLNVQQASPIAATRQNGATSDLLSAGSGEAHQRAIAALSQQIWKQATVLSIIDGFWLSFIAAALALCALVFVSRAPRGPLAPS
jgi:DHA2 family multidrug resistance protein